MPPSEPIPGLGSGGRISYVDFLLHKAQLSAMPSHPLLHFLRRSLALCPCPWPNQSIPGVNNANQWRTYDQIDKTSQLTWIHSLLDQRIKVVAISSSRASSRRKPAYRRSGVSRDDRTTKDGSKSYLFGLPCSAASTASPFASLCELTHDLVSSSERGAASLVARPLHCKERLVR